MNRRQRPAWGWNPQRQVEPGYRQEGEPSCWPHSVPLPLIVFREKKILCQQPQLPFFILLSVFTILWNCSHWSHNLQIQLTHFHFLVMFPLPMMLALRTGMNVSTSVYLRAQWLILRKHQYIFWKEWIIVIDEGKTSITSSLDSHSILLKVFCCHLLFVICVPKGCAASTGSRPNWGLAYNRCSEKVCGINEAGDWCDSATVLRLLQWFVINHLRM